MSKHLGNRIGFGITVFSDGGLFNLSSQYFLKRKNKWIASGELSGGTELTPGNGYKYNVFTSTGITSVFGGEVYVDYMIVAGGGGGGTGWNAFTDTSGGGGGAGGYLEGNVLLSPGTYTINVGAGGNGSPIATPGNSSFITGPVGFTSITATGGGAGGYFTTPPATSTAGAPGGSGGGGGGSNSSPTTGGLGVFEQGTYGASGGDTYELGTYPQGSTSAGGGGGGAAGIATDPTSRKFAGNGGIGRILFNGDTGIPSTYGTSGPQPGRYFGGGGGGGIGVWPAPTAAVGGVGGFGGGGPGGDPLGPPQTGTNGTANTGGGGGGGCASSPLGSNAPGGAGGSGIIILRRRNDLPFNVVRSGLSLEFDAGNSQSYVGVGTTWTDLSGNGKNATLLNGVSYSSSNQGSLVFDGVDDYCTVPEIGSLTRFTIESWFRPTSYLNNSAATISAVFPGSGTVNFKIGYEGSTQMYGGFYDGAWRYTPAVSTTLNTWQHIMFTYDGSNLRIYSNGILVGSTAYVGTPSSSGSGIVMGKRWDFAEYFAGNIAINRVYNRALEASEIQQNFYAGRGRFGI